MSIGSRTLRPWGLLFLGIVLTVGCGSQHPKPEPKPVDNETRVLNNEFLRLQFGDAVEALANDLKKYPAADGLSRVNCETLNTDAGKKVADSARVLGFISKTASENLIQNPENATLKDELKEVSDLSCVLIKRLEEDPAIKCRSEKKPYGVNRTPNDLLREIEISVNRVKGQLLEINCNLAPETAGCDPQ